MASSSNPAGGNPVAKRLLSPAKENLGAPYAKAVKGVTLEDLKELLDGFAGNVKSEFCSVKDDLKQLNTKISSVENNVKVLGPELARVTSRVQNLQRQMDLQYRQKAAEYAWDHPNYIAQMCNMRAFGEAVNTIMTEVGDTRAPGAYAAAEALLRSKFADGGVKFGAEGDLYVTRLMPSRTLPSGRQLGAVIFFTVASRYRDVLVRRAVRVAVQAQGIEYRTNLSAILMENKKRVEQHAKFKAALERLPQGVQPIWRLDWCSLEGKWPDNEPEKIYNVFTLAPHEEEAVDLMHTDG